MKCHFLHNGVKLFQLNPVGGILFILGGNVPAGSREPGRFMFGAFENDLNPVFFLRHVDGLNFSDFWME
jgi:hypothetical protein